MEENHKSHVWFLAIIGGQHLVEWTIFHMPPTNFFRFIWLNLMPVVDYKPKHLEDTAQQVQKFFNFNFKWGDKDATSIKAVIN